MKNLFVGNLSFQTTESDLRALLSPSDKSHACTWPWTAKRAEREASGSSKWRTTKKRRKQSRVSTEKTSGGRNIKVNRPAPRSARVLPAAPAAAEAAAIADAADFTKDYGGAARQPREPRW